MRTTFLGGIGMRFVKQKRRALALLLSAALLVSQFGIPAYAEEVASTPLGTSSLCTHHTAHTEDCGFIAAVPETPC